MICLWNSKRLTFYKAAFNISILVCHLNKAYNSKLLGFLKLQMNFIFKSCGLCRPLASFSFSSITDVNFSKRKKKWGWGAHNRTPVLARGDFMFLSYRALVLVSTWEPCPFSWVTWLLSQEVGVEVGEENGPSSILIEYILSQNLGGITASPADFFLDRLGTLLCSHGAKQQMDCAEEVVPKVTFDHFITHMEIKIWILSRNCHWARVLVWFTISVQSILLNQKKKKKWQRQQHRLHMKPLWEENNVHVQPCTVIPLRYRVENVHTCVCEVANHL